MELKLAYRLFRMASTWMVGGWYSDVFIGGFENVPKTGPLILAVTHHNEIVDIAVLSASTPHGRPICFWAKSSMFKHPVMSFIMESGGAIRVHRSPNRVSSEDTSGTSTPTNSTRSVQPDLFEDTSLALSKGEAIGIFPEGTSYTLPAIAQVLPGAAWAAVEYVRAVRAEKLALCTSEKERRVYLNGEGRRGERTGLGVVPVGIVYEDKRRYMSRVCVWFGEPVEVDDYTEELFDEEVDPEEAAKVVARKLNAEIERGLVGLTVNAPDWETLYAARTAMKILWADQENVHLETWVDVSQSLVNLLSSPEPDEKLNQVRKSLMRYYSLLYYTHVNHTTLLELVPLLFTPDSTPTLDFPAILRAFFNLALGFPLALVWFVAFFPTFLFHIPGYIVSWLLLRAFGSPREEETHAEYRAIGGGLGIGLSTISILGVLWGMGALTQLGLLGLSISVYTSVYILCKWHLLLIKRNLRQFRRLTTFVKLVLGALSRDKLRPKELQVYSTSPPPPVNVFVKGPSNADAINAKHPPPISPGKLMRELLHARLQAHINLGNYLRSLDREEVTFLLSQGARVPSVVS
ncbi:hypothetical protein P691DRAFT_776198 [Macrolepiota fuliginosa MF-IS2]|uniref:Phospholipid/glycerol acyltransferase domain-containing protein n=1 Tax=Macrolepiota fuliginosa MF-IS2 TaxID=1400762 RepID=A0A9P6C3J8_9AGAR|nr:hypothetical protein P691DRAFT_776198 [Macrolepiota fuliginosa MF-IS2]